ncbi:urease accessory protein UreF [Vibrio comitans]|uniref:Urease accessory protein UreF n=1 Tax=Vibrio comitans NBRC 102076 TaxID=1219078 RepID=A0A4Y3IQ57_9VIBR|nr:urease accessory UreF family protein [Vibrio comitans]GEA61252.1 urease accessory protein UreF [Vibrio comitans NBRC 102076]
MSQEISTVPVPDVACYRLFQLISPSLPIGGFTYSQGLEFAVEAGWVSDRHSMEQWLNYMVSSSVATLELPILDRLYTALETGDLDAIEYWCDFLYTSRETSELRAEEKQRGLALNTLLTKLQIDISVTDSITSHPNQLLGLCIAARHWSISVESLKQGYLWSWLENIVTAGVKLIPLGQTDGQLALINITSSFPQVIVNASQIETWMIGSFSPSIALASSLHETQYTRLFRS